MPALSASFHFIWLNSSCLIRLFQHADTDCHVNNPWVHFAWERLQLPRQMTTVGPVWTMPVQVPKGSTGSKLSLDITVHCRAGKNCQIIISVTCWISLISLFHTQDFRNLRRYKSQDFNITLLNSSSFSNITFTVFSVLLVRAGGLRRWERMRE